MHACMLARAPGWHADGVVFGGRASSLARRVGMLLECYLAAVRARSRAGLACCWSAIWQPCELARAPGWHAAGVLFGNRASSLSRRVGMLLECYLATVRAPSRAG